MKNIADRYFDDKNVMDLEIISTLGLTNDDILQIQKLEGVSDVEGAYSKDAVVTTNENEDIVLKVHSLPEKINMLDVTLGRLPESDYECVVEEAFLQSTGLEVGSSINLRIEKDDAEEKEFLKNSEFKIVGTIKSPLYISRDRGSTKLASGKISAYMFVPKTVINSDIYTQIYITGANLKNLNSFTSNYENKVDIVKDKILVISDERKDNRYNNLKQEAQIKVADAEKELNSSKEDAEIQIKDAEDKISDAKDKIISGQNEIDNASREIKNNENKASIEFANADKKILEAEKKLQESKIAIDNGKKEYENKKIEAEDGLKKINYGIDTANSNIASLKIQKQQAEENGQDTTAIDNMITVANNTLNGLITQKENINSKLKMAENTIISGENEFKNGKKELEKQKITLSSTKKDTNTKIANAKKKIEKAKTDLEDAKAEVQKGENELTTKKLEMDEKVADAQNKIDDAKDKINDIKKPTWYILNRKTNIGFASYAQDADRIANLGKVFPIVFFVVAGLISLTSMTRMVEEKRGEIGTLKALGYKKLSIAKKYLVYALLAALIGSLVGMLVGFYTLPRLITNMYAMMYTVPKTNLEFNITYAISGLVIALGCTVGATIYSCIKELKSTPATLMRPKSPKVGKRVFLERITLIWSKLKFSHKVTVRNVFRYKKRFLMTIIGIMGCTALIMAGFGLRDSVSGMIPSQYGEIFKYQMSVNYKDDISRSDLDKMKEKINEYDGINNVININEQAVSILDKNNTQDISLIIPENVDEFQEYIKIEDIKTKKNLVLDTNGVVLTEKIAKLLNIKKGDKIRIENNDDEIAEVTVSAITRNYLMHYMYMSPDLYNQIYGENVKYNSSLGITIDMTEEQEKVIGKIMLENSNISKISFNSDTKSIFDNVMENMSFVVLILITCAGMLAFVVLYNLSNVNIGERIRELATIKVLGFYDKEVYKYVTRETIILTLIGIAIGLVAGYVLNIFIIRTCELDMFMFDSRIHFTTYLYSAILTIIFTVIVNIVTYYSLKKIDMIDSLKSVE